jgi:hypothetical protein
MDNNISLSQEAYKDIFEGMKLSKECTKYIKAGESGGGGETDVQVESLLNTLTSIIGNKEFPH